MKTEKKSLGECTVQISAELDAAEVAAVVKDVEKAFVRNVKLPGFRPGKVPLEMIRSKFASDISNETTRVAVERSIPRAVEAEKLEAIAVTEVKDVEVKPEGGKFTVIVEVKPDVKLPDYKKIKIEKKDVTVQDADLAERIGYIREQNAKYEDAKEGAVAAEGDFVQIDFSGTVGGKPVSEVAPDEKVLGGRQGFWMLLKEGAFVKEIVEAVKGMKVGDKKDDVAVKFDDERAPEALKGLKAVYSVELKAVRSRTLPTDEELAKLAGKTTYDEFQSFVREEMQKMADAAELERRREAAYEAVLAQCRFDVPPSQLERLKDACIERFSANAQRSGVDAEFFKKNKEKIEKDAEDAALGQLRFLYAAREIAKAEKIECTDAECNQKIIDFILGDAAK
jgi:trigger factor